MALTNNSWWVTDDPQTELDELTARGFTVDPNTGQIVGFNETLFALYISNKYDIIYASDKCFHYYEKGVWKKYDIDEFKAFMYEELQEPRFGVWKASMEYSYMEALKRELYIPTPLNSSKHLINVENGMLDINNSKLLPHDKAYYSTIRIPVMYDPAAKCPRFEAFCSEVFEKDLQRVHVLCEWLGLLLSTDMNAQKALILLGYGSNGKSVLISIISELIGEANIGNVMLNSLGKQFALASLFGKTANISSENNNSYFDSAVFKAMVSGDRIHAAHKYGEEFDFSPILKFVFAMNCLPNTRDLSNGYFRRLCILHFSAHFPQDKCDPKLVDKLKTELAGILNFSLEGLLRLRANDYQFSTCDSMDNLLEQYRRDQSPILMFVADHVIASEGSRTDNPLVLGAFKKWAKENGFTTYENVSPIKFWQAFDNCCVSRGIKTENKHSSSVRFHTGFVLKNSSPLSATLRPKVTTTRLFED